MVARVASATAVFAAVVAVVSDADARPRRRHHWHRETTAEIVPAPRDGVHGRDAASAPSSAQVSDALPRNAVGARGETATRGAGAIARADDRGTASIAAQPRPVAASASAAPSPTPAPTAVPKSTAEPGASKDDTAQRASAPLPPSDGAPQSASGSARSGGSVALTSVELEGGEVPRAEASLQRLASNDLPLCLIDEPAVKNDATMKLRFLVRGAGRVEGLDIVETRGVPRAVARCIAASLDRKRMGDASDDPVAVTVGLRMSIPSSL